MKHATRILLGFMTLFGFCTIEAMALDPSRVPEKKRTELGLYLDAAEVQDFIKAHPNTLFVDVRTRAEVNYLGMPTTADANIPYLELDTFWTWDDKKSVFRLELNPRFIPAVEKRLQEKGLNASANIILLCRSGDRSAAAANLLARQGYKSVYTVVDGYEGDMATGGDNKGRRSVNGWRNAGLPWSYELVKAKMLLE